MKASEIREMSPEELVSRLNDARQELFNLRFQHATGQLENTSRLGRMKKDIARIKTVLSQKGVRV
jgi:large subunit ribosomal protein L29